MRESWHETDSSLRALSESTKVAWKCVQNLAQIRDDLFLGINLEGKLKGLSAPALAEPILTFQNASLLKAT